MKKKIVFITLVVLAFSGLFLGRTQEARGEIQCDINQMIFYFMDGCNPCEMVKPKIAQVEALGVSVTRLKRGVDPIPPSVWQFPSFDINGSIYSGNQTFEWFKGKLGCKDVVAPPVPAPPAPVPPAPVPPAPVPPAPAPGPGLAPVCNPPYTDYSYPGIAGTWCCRTVGIGGCFAGETVNASGDCCEFVDDIVPPPPVVSDNYDNPLLWKDIPEFVERTVIFFFTILLYSSPLLIIIGAYVMATSGGIPSRIDLGRKIIIWTLIGLAVILISRALIMLVHIAFKGSSL